MKGIGECCTLISETKQVLVRNDYQRIDISLKLLNAILGLFHPPLALKFKRFGNHTNGQNASFTGGPGNHRGGASAGATTHASGDKDHIAISQFCHDLC